MQGSRAVRRAGVIRPAARQESAGLAGIRRTFWFVRIASNIDVEGVSPMRVFMLGWEFPPFISGGLGTACFGLTRAMSELGHEVIFVLPQAVGDGAHGEHVQLRSPTPAQIARANRATTYTSHFPAGMTNVEVRSIPSSLRPYDRPGGEQGELRTTTRVNADGTTEVVVVSDSETVTSAADQPTSVVDFGQSSAKSDHYGGDMFFEVHRYARLAVEIALGESFDVIHAHDWMTYAAGIAVSAATGKPLVVHVHSTEFDRSGEHVNQAIYDIERHGVHAADKVIAVSMLTRGILLNRYAANGDKVEVVYNAIDKNGSVAEPPPAIRRDEKIVLFLGRITMQKGPEYFLMAAKKVLEYEPNTRFIMAGSGDMIRSSIELAAELGIGHKVMFPGFLRGDDVTRVFKMADLYVMPSVSEPFGIAPLEALSNDVPVIISKTSGVSEILSHVLKVDFWDVAEMANKIIAVLRHPPLRAALKEHGTFEVRRLTWKESARGCIDVYQNAIDAGAHRA